MPNIEQFKIESGRKIKEDETVVNTADKIEELENKMGDIAENPTEQYSLLYRIAQLESKLDTMINDGVPQSGSIVASKKAVRSGAINTATSEEILNVQKEIYIDEFVINFGAVSNVDLRLRIDFFDGNAFQPYELTDGGAAYTTSRIYESTAKYSGYFEIINAASPLIIGLKKDYIHKKGIKVQLLNDTGASQDVYVSIQYSEGE